MKGKNRCVICYRKHDQWHNFPIEFPSKWRMCCGCRWIAFDVVRSTTKKIIDFYTRMYHTTFVERIFLKRKLRKINKLINVV